MGEWHKILFERRLLLWSSVLSFLGLGMWAAALATPHWLVQSPASLHHNLTHSLPSPLLSPGLGRGLVWAHSGLFSLSSLVEGDTGLSWHHEAWVVARVPALHSELVMAGFALFLGLAAVAFSAYSVRRPYLMVRRMAAVLHLLVAASTLTVIQLVDTAGHSGALHPPSPQHHLHYGYSFLLAWAATLVSFSVCLTFCCASKTRKLLRNDNVTFMNRRLVITADVKS